jgi:fumarate reductase subunit D
MAKKKTIEPLLWLLFSAGGVVAALLLPVLVLVFGVLVPLGWDPGRDRLLALLHNPLTRLVLFGAFTLALFHGAHRFRFTLYDGLQIKHLNELINPICYGGAVLGAIAAACLLWQVP